MRSIFIFAMLMAQLLLINSIFADTESYDDCKASCAGDKATRDADCPSPYDASPENQAREQCLKQSRESYNNCVKNCPPPTPPESSTLPMPY